MSHSTQADIQDIPSIVQPQALSSEPLPDPLFGNLEISGKPIYQGTFSDVYKGIWKYDTKEIIVCIKVLRRCGVREPVPGLTEDDRFERRIKREMLIWSAADHRNVVRFIGYQWIKDSPWLVSPWIEKRSLADYVRLTTGVSRAAKLKMLQDATTGLAYLHGLKPWIAHGDLKPENILILDDCTAALCDFGTSRVMADLSGHTGFTTSGSAAGTAGYQAKELISGNTLPTTSSDIYAVGGVILWTMSGKEPFYHEKTKAKVFFAIILDQKCQPAHHPELGADDLLWELLNQCWESEPKSRPDAMQVVRELDAAILREPPPYSEGTI
ncbi:hypothetical protein FRC01_005260 [Tulasnella sp. 417]|nr:hypothetical protein FRC01_005260 [Tulasnella sp. 417]